MDKADLDPFIIGLKKIIKSSFPSQEEFAKGVTSKVNLSNVLRGQSGTSQKMRTALASKAEMTVEEVIALGKQSLIGATTTDLRTRSSQDGFGKVAEMSAAEIYARLGEVNQEISEGLAWHTRNITEAVSSLTSERDKLVSQLHQDQAAMNAINDQIRVIDADMKIVYSNRAATKEGEQFIGAIGRNSEKEMCAKVFASGKPERKVFEVDGKWYSNVAYPMYASSGLVDRAVLITQDLSPWIELFQEQGWVIPE
jgi:transcriptional regulator with PAS, ATPase and Fis domain